MITFAALASVALIFVASEVVAHSLARVPGLGAEPETRYTVSIASGQQLPHFARP